MALPTKIRSGVKRALVTVPAHRALPPGELRRFAAIHHHAANSTPAEVCAEVDTSGRVPKRFSAAMAAARAAYTVGRDDLVDDILVDLSRRFPDAAAVPLLRSDLSASRGDHSEALAAAHEARLLDPDWAHAASQVVWLSDLVLGRAAADRVAVDAVRRFPRWGRVLWAVCRACVHIDQFEQVAEAWRDEVHAPEHVLAGVRPLAQTAARVGRLDTAVELYAEAILLWLHGIRSEPVATSRTLEDKDPTAVVADVVEALDGAGIPFFFAAGTALGLVRDGQPVGHDVDIDIGVFAADWDRAAIVAAFRKHPRFLPNVAHPDNPKVAVRHRAGAPIDVFRFYEEDGGVWHEGTFMRWRNSPFEVERRTIRGVEVPLPTDAERYLVENYGEGWTVPDADFDAFIDAPNVETTWPEYLEYYRVRRAYLQLDGGDVRAALHDLEDAHDALARTPSGRQVLALLGHDVDPPSAAAPTVDLDLRTELGPLAHGELPLEPGAARHVARHLRARGDRDRAIATIESAMRGEGWRDRLLWHERVTLMESPDDYPAVRELFWASPRECHTGVGALRAVARAACIAGEHEEGRALLRKAIVQRAEQQQARRWRDTAHRGGQRLSGWLRRGTLSDEERRARRDAKITEAFEDLDVAMAEAGTRCFLVAGTFLGLVREGTVISWDKDVDVGVWRDDIDLAALEETLAAADAFSVRRLDLTTDRLRVNHRTGTKFDIFPHYVEDGKVWHDGASTRWWNSPFDLVEVDFLGTRQLAPADAEHYLTESYGDWRTPDPTFDARIDAPNVELTDPEYFTSLQYFDLLRSVMKGDRRRIDRHRSILREHGEDGWLDLL